MGRQDYNKGLADLRDLRAELGVAEKTLAAASAARDKLRDQRARKVMQTAAAFEGAKADAIAKAAGMSVGEVVEIAPLLDPTPVELRSAPAAQPEPSPPSPRSPSRPGPLPWKPHPQPLRRRQSPFLRPLTARLASPRRPPPRTRRRAPGPRAAGPAG